MYNINVLKEDLLYCYQYSKRFAAKEVDPSNRDYATNKEVMPQSVCCPFFILL